MQEGFSNPTDFTRVASGSLNKWAEERIREIQDLRSEIGSVVAKLEPTILRLKQEIPEIGFSFGPSDDQDGELFLMLYLDGSEMVRATEICGGRRIDLSERFFVTVLTFARRP